MDVRAQLVMVFNLDKCIGCHACSISCKNIWTDRRGAEYMWWNNVETKPGIGYPKKWEDQGTFKGGWVVDGGQPPASGPRERADPPQHVLPAQHAEDGGLLRAVRLRLRQPLRGRGRDRPAGGRGVLPDIRPEDRDDPGGAQLGRRSLRLAALCREGRQPGRERDRRGVRQDVHAVPSADLQPLPESGVRRLVPFPGHLQAGRGRRRPGGPERLQGVAFLHQRLPLQKGVLQLGQREGGKMHLLLSAHRDRAVQCLRPQLRRPDPARRRPSLRRGKGRTGASQAR